MSHELTDASASVVDTLLEEARRDLGGEAEVAQLELRVVQGVGAGGGGGVGAILRSSPVAKAVVVVGAFALVVGSGLLVRFIVRRPAPASGTTGSVATSGVRLPVVQPSAAADSALVGPTVASATPVLSQADRHDPDVVPSGSNGQPPVWAGGVSHPSETAILEAARGALTGSPARALALVEEHQRFYAGGVLAQEREIIAIDALMRLGRSRAAQARGEAFYRAFPRSAHTRRVDALLGRGGSSSPP